jgi:DNA-binding transcriptional MerR regulator
VHDDPYSLSDLCRIADVTPRTVRYYVAQGLLRSPDAAGPATRYGEGHLARLRLIKRLQREHLPLAEIRNRLERLDDVAVGDLLSETTSSEMAGPAAPVEPEDTLSFVRGLLARTGVNPSQQPASPMAQTAKAAMPSPPAAPGPRVNREMAMGWPARRISEARLAMDPPRPAARPTWPEEAAPDVTPSALTGAADRSTWERLSISPDVEIHVRRPLDRLSNKRVEQLARLARELFGEER